MRSRTYLSLSFLLLVSSLAGGFTESGNSFSTGRTSVSGGGKAFASTGGTTRSTVRTRTSVSSTGRPKTTTSTSTSTGSGETTSTEYTTKKRSGGRRKKATTTEEVKLGEGTSLSMSSASGTGSVSASSTASSTPTYSEGSASTTVGGKTRTVTKKRGSKGAKASKGSGLYKHYPTCRGMAYYKCCADRVFEEIDGNVYCGCFGDEPTADYCSFMRLNSKPLVVQDVFGSMLGDVCVCAEDRVTTNEIVNGCRGTVKRDCCDTYNGDNKCRCQGDRCAYTRISDKPLIWKSRTSNRACICH